MSMLTLTGCQRKMDVTTIPDIVYKTYEVEGKKGEILLDLYLPQTNKPVPVIVYIHGGGWLEGSKELCPKQIIAQQGFALACINYRLSYVAVFPAQIQDVKDAVIFLKANASKYNLDPDKFGVWGPSAGGHLSALLGTSAGVASLDGETENSQFDSSVQAVITFFPPTDFTQVPPTFVEPLSPSVYEKYAHLPLFRYTEATTGLLGGPVEENLDLANLANPITHIDSSDPPFLIVHGLADDVVPISQSDLLAKALQDKGIEVTFIQEPDRKHSSYGPKGQRFDPKLIDLVIEFGDRHLR